MNFLSLTPLVPSECNNVLHAPAIAYSRSQCHRAHPRQFRKFRNWHFLAVKDNKYSVSLIASVLRFCYPVAVFGTISAFIVSAVNLIFWSRSLSHIGKKVSKCFPSLADCYSASTVFVPPRMAWVSASLHHNLPHIVFRRISHSVGSYFVPMLSLKASTTLYKSLFEFSCRGYFCIAALAAAKPERVPGLPSCIRNNFKSVESHADQVFESTSMFRYTIVRHLGLLFSSTKFRGWQAATCCPRFYLINAVTSIMAE